MCSAIARRIGVSGSTSPSATFAAGGGGATGAGNYPSLAKDANLESGDYPVYVVVRGQRAMPPVGAMMSDDQVAAVVNYVRTHFGNQYQDTVTAEDVKRVRP